MRTWVRAPHAFVCGSCGEIRPAGAPLLKLYLPGLKNPKSRCEACAGDAAPAGLPFEPPLPTQPAPILTRVDEDGIERPISAPRALEPMRRPFVDFSQRLLGEK